MVTNVIKVIGSRIAPNPIEVDYWVDTRTNPYGADIKYHNGIDWVNLFKSGNSEIDLSNYYTKRQVDSKLIVKADTSTVNDLFSTLNDTKADKTSTYTKSEINTLFLNFDPFDESKYYTKVEIDTKGYLTDIPAVYITEDELSAFTYDKETIDSTLATKKYVDDQIKNIEHPSVDLTDYATKTYVADEIAKAALGGKVDLTGYATEQWVEEKGYITEHLDISHLASKDYVDNGIADLVDGAPETLNTLNEISEALKENEDVVSALSKAISSKADKTSLEGLATEEFVKEQINAIEHPTVDLTGYATEEWVEAEIAKIEPGSNVDVSTLATKTELTTVEAKIPTDSTIASWGYTKNTGTYSKPNDGIPVSDLSEDIQNLLEKANNSLQDVPMASSEEYGGVTANEKTSNYTTEVKIDSSTGILYVPEIDQISPDEEDITVDIIGEEKILKFNDKEYNKNSYSGLGRKYLRKNIANGVNILTLTAFTNADGTEGTNTRYIIQYDYDLNGDTIIIPEGCVLEFQGGSFKNGTIKGDNTFISSIGDTAIFGNSLTIAGSFKNEYAVLTWWGAQDSCESWTLKNYDVSECFELFIASPFRKLYIPKGYWYIGKTVEFTRQFALKMAGDVGEITEIESAMIMKRPNDHAVVYTDLDITVFRIKSNAGTTVAWSYVSDIVGGIIDVSNCRNYTSNTIEYLVSNGLSIGGGKIATTIVGYSDTSLLSKNNSAICLIGSGNIGSYVWNLEFRSAIAGFTKAVYVKDGGRTNNYTVWINGLMDYNRTAKCCQSFVSDFGDYNVIAGEYQSGSYFTASDYKNYAQVAIGGLNNKFDGRVWDFRGTFNGMQSNYYALELLPSSSNTDVSKVIQGLYPDAVKNYTNDVYGKYNASLGKFGYEDIENFFIDNPYLSIETECVGCSITSTYNSPNQLLRPYNKKVLTFTITEDTATAKITLNIADKDSWGGRFRLLLAGITLSTYKGSYFSKVTFNYYIDDSLVHTEEKVVMPTSGFTFDRIYSSIETLYKYSTINKVEFLLSDFIYTAASKTVDVAEIFGKVDNQPVPWMLSSAGGEFYGTFYKNGKTYMNNKVYDGLSSLPSTAANGAIMDVSGQMAIRDDSGWAYLSKDMSDVTSARPSVKHAGMCYFDTTIGKPIWWTGSKWVDATGTTV